MTQSLRGSVVSLLDARYCEDFHRYLRAADRCHPMIVFGQRGLDC